MGESCSFTAALWPWKPEGGWFFVTLPPDAAEAVRERPRPPRGFGSVRVRAAIGATTWTTSVFPDSGSGSYVLPVKKAVRRAEGLDDGDEVQVELDLLE
jgi:uncharacterized protein DUF1905